MTTTQSTPTTVVRTTSPNGDAALAPGRWRIDPGHTEVAFVGRHFGLTKIRGRFPAVIGTVQLTEPMECSIVAADIDMASVTSGDHARDQHLRSSDLFDVEHHPVATFRSTAIEVQGSTGWLTGDLTIKGATHPVRLHVELVGTLRDPWGGERAVLRATTTIDRYRWGVSWNMPLDAGGLLVSKDIRLEIEVELVRETDASD